MRNCWTLSAILVLFTASIFLVSDLSAQEKKEKKKKSGTVIGVVTKKGKNFIEVKAFGEAKPRKYVPHWRGGLPKDGGGLDKKMLATIRKIKVGTRVQLMWEFEERLRVVQVKELKKTDKKTD